MNIPVYDSYEEFLNETPSSHRDENKEGADENYFYYKMHDDSLSPEFEKDCYILMRKQKKAKNGEIVLVQIGSEYYLRKISYDKDFLTLSAINESHETFNFAGFSLNRAKVKAVIVN